MLQAQAMKEKLKARFWMGMIALMRFLVMRALTLLNKELIAKTMINQKSKIMKG